MIEIRRGGNQIGKRQFPFDVEIIVGLIIESAALERFVGEMRDVRVAIELIRHSGTGGPRQIVGRYLARGIFRCGFGEAMKCQPETTVFAIDHVEHCGDLEGLRGIPGKRRPEAVFLEGIGVLLVAGRHLIDEPGAVTSIPDQAQRQLVGQRNV